MVVAVTGASGHVGGNLVRALLDRGRTVRALVRDDQRALEGLDLEIVSGDVTDPSSLVPLMEGADVVYHLAAYISIDGDQGGAVPRINVDGTRNVMTAAHAAGVRRVIHMSSIHALADEPKGRVINETCDLAVDDRFLAYDRSKARGEMIVREFVDKGLDVVTVNPGAVVGREDYKPSAMGEFLLDLYHRRLPALVDGGFAWTDVRDVVEATLAAEERGKTGERYLLAGRWAPFTELASICEACTGRAAPRLVAPTWLAAIGAPFVSAFARVSGRRPLYTSESVQIVQHHRNVDFTKAKEELGFTPRPLSETIEDAYAWFERAQMLS